MTASETSALANFDENDNDKLISLCEDLALQANAGQIQAIVFGVVDANNRIRTHYAGGSTVRIIAAAAAAYHFAMTDNANLQLSEDD